MPRSLKKGPYINFKLEKKVVAMDKAIRHQERHKDKFKNSEEILDELYLHRDGIPIDKVDFDNKKEDQLDLFQNECEGMCGN